MKQVMKMKKAMIVLLIAFLVMTILLAGLFFWKGGHHALRLSGIMDEWLEADEADNTLTLDLSGLETDPDRRRSTENDPVPLEANLFWTEYGDEPLFGLTIQEMTTWTDGENLYLETGGAYALPKLSILEKPARKFMMMGFLLFGRVTKDDDTYTVSMKCGGLDVNMDVVADRSLEELTATVRLPDGTDLSASLVSEKKNKHRVPQEISDAIVHAEMEPPAPLGEAIAVLYPAFDNLLPLRGELSLQVEGNIEQISETMDFTMDRRTIELEQDGETVIVDLPAALSGTDPKLLGLLLLQYGTFENDGDTAEFEIHLADEETTMLCSMLAPQIEKLGIEFSESRITLTIEDGMLTSVTLNADGELGLVFETTPVYFAAELVTD